MECPDALLASSIMIPLIPIVVFFLHHHIAIFKQSEILLHTRTGMLVVVLLLLLLDLSCLPSTVFKLKQDNE